MKKRSLTLSLITAIFSLPLVTFAGAEAGDDTANYYSNHPEAYDGKKVDVDCAFVSRITGGPQVDNVVFFLAHTVDRDNRTPGGSVAVAVLEKDVTSFVRKFGTTMERTPGQSHKFDTTTLHGTLHQTDRGRIYIDESGDAFELIRKHQEATGELLFDDDGAGNREIEQRFRQPKV